MTIEYRNGKQLDPAEVSELYRASTLSERRPSNDLGSMEAMLEHANLVITAWEAKLLVGIARSFSDFTYITYLADLAVRRDHQRRGIGLELMRRTKAAAGPRANLILAAAPAAEAYYRHVGFTRHHSAWWLNPGDVI